MYYLNGKYGLVETVKVKPIDTTGAGDAFFGTFLANIENKEWTEENIKNALVKANKAGAETTQFLGAIKL
jgi:sugar/nucleoside kinase (ribokinase family)